MHTYHGDIHEVGLVDECPDCEDHAKEPFRSLDKDMLTQLVIRNCEYRWGKHKYDYEPRSHAEAVAMAQITNTMEHMGNLFEVAPGYMATYLHDRWHIGIAHGAA